MTRNEWCQVLGIEQPSLVAAADHRDANSYALLLVALLERGQAMTLLDVAARFEELGIAERGRALLSLQRCKPARPPVYREGDHYHLDPYDAELDLWAYRLGLRPPRVAPAAKVAIEVPPAPPLNVPLAASELEEAWRDASLFNWSRQRLVLAVLDVEGGLARFADGGARRRHEETLVRAVRPSDPLVALATHLAALSQRPRRARERGRRPGAPSQRHAQTIETLRERPG